MILPPFTIKCRFATVKQNKAIWLITKMTQTDSVISFLPPPSSSSIVFIIPFGFPSLSSQITLHLQKRIHSPNNKLQENPTTRVQHDDPHLRRRRQFPDHSRISPPPSLTTASGPNSYYFTSPDSFQSAQSDNAIASDCGPLALIGSVLAFWVTDGFWGLFSIVLMSFLFDSRSLKRTQMSSPATGRMEIVDWVES